MIGLPTTYGVISSGKNIGLRSLKNVPDSGLPELNKAPDWKKQVVEKLTFHTYNKLYRYYMDE